MEGLYRGRVKLFPHAGKFDGLARGGLDREGSAAARVRVELGEEDAVYADGAVKSRGGVDRVLPCHRVDDEHDLVWVDGVLDRAQLVHEGLVYVEAAGRVEKDHVEAVVPSVGDGFFRDFHGADLPELKDGDADLPADGFKLFDGGGTVHVTRSEERAVAQRVFTVAGELCAVRRLARALKADHHDCGRRLWGNGQL